MTVSNYSRRIQQEDGSIVNVDIAIEASHSSSDCYGVDDPSTGNAVWFAAQNLCNLLQQERHELTQAKCILELGAGPGLAGICAAKLCCGSPTKFVLTDGDDEVVELLRRNCIRNGLLDKHVTTDTLLWGHDEQLKALLDAFPRGFDVILGADLVYEKFNVQLLTKLIQTVASLISEDGVFYLGFTRRNLPIELVMECANQHGLVWELQEDYTYDIFDTNTDGQTCFWRDAIYSFRKGDGQAQAEQEQEKRQQQQQQEDDRSETST